jgi:alpha-galactosidase
LAKEEIMKIVIIGAGSRSFGRGQLADMLQATDLRGQNVTLWLVDESERALETMLGLAERMKAHTGADITLRSTTDRCTALPGADYVITAVARRRMQLWEQDFRVPLAYGFQHCLGENGGPGAVFHALRSLNLVMPICQDIERLCPGALLLNFTNPEARVLHAILHLTKVKAAGICHGVFNALANISRYLERPVDDLYIVSAGMNHFFYILKVKDKRTGEDLLDELRKRALADQSGRVPPLFRKMVEIFGMFTYMSDDHIGEYLSFGSEFGGVKWHYGQEAHPVPLQDLPAAQPSLEDYATGKRPLDDWVMRTSGEITVPIICDIEFDRKMWRPAVNVLNTGLYIENLPAGGAIEIPAIVDAAGIHPQKVGVLPEPVAALIRTQFSIIELVTEAYRTRSKKLLLQALLLDPVANSIAAAEKLLDDMFELQKEYLPEFS